MYANPESENGPTDYSINGCIQIDGKLIHYRRNTNAYTAENPASEKGKETNCHKCSELLPFGPIEWIIDIVRGLRNENNLVGKFLFMKFVVN
jgi:hypothetical protein